MQRGMVEGTYLVWRSSTRGGMVRTVTAGLGASDRLGAGMWPSRADAFRCDSCGTIVIDTNETRS